MRSLDIVSGMVHNSSFQPTAHCLRQRSAAKLKRWTPRHTPSHTR